MSTTTERSDHFWDLEFGGVELDEGPVSVGYYPISSTTDTSLLDKNRAPWTMQGFSSTTGAAFTMEPQQPPTAVIDGPADVDEGAVASFDGSGSFDPEDDPMTYVWNFGDGSAEETGVTATHVYADNGTYTVSLTVDDGHTDSSDVDTYQITVNNVPPTAEAGPGQTVFRNEALTVSGSWTDPAGVLDNAYGWAWDLDGDGGVDDVGTAPHGSTIPRGTVFALEGFYDLIFGVTDKDGGYGEDTVQIEVLNRPSDCSAAAPSITSIWSPNNKMVPVTISGFTDPEGDSVTAFITGIFQDEPVAGKASGSFAPDGSGIGSSTALVRAERDGGKKNPGNGRVYVISYTADDGHGGTCDGNVSVGVPHGQDGDTTAVNDGAVYDSTATP